MVTNLPENAKAQWRKVSEAKDPEIKLKELQKFYSLVPKHKGTKNLLKQVTRQMARLREEIEIKRKKSVGSYISEWNKPKHGVGRIVILGDDYFLVKKLFNILSNKTKDFFSYWKFEPEYSVIESDHVQFQLVALPPLGISDSVDYKIFNFIKAADFIILPLNLLERYRKMLNILHEKGIIIGGHKINVKIKKTATGGIRVIGISQLSKKAIKELLKSYKIYNAIVKINENVLISDIEDYILNLTIRKNGAVIILGRCIELYDIKNHTHISKVGCIKESDLVEYLLEKLSLIRVFPRSGKKENVTKPIILKKDSRVIDLASSIHSRLAKHFRYAIVTRDNTQIKVSKNFILKDKDIVEIRAF